MESIRAPGPSAADQPSAGKCVPLGPPESQLSAQVRSSHSLVLQRNEALTVAFEESSHPRSLAFRRNLSTRKQRTGGRVSPTLRSPVFAPASAVPDTHDRELPVARDPKPQPGTICARQGGWDEETGDGKGKRGGDRLTPSCCCWGVDGPAAVETVWPLPRVTHVTM